MKASEARSGYVKDFKFNPDWKEQGCICGYEHCIELMPLGEPSAKSCRLFGHDCPGGAAMVKKCKKTINDVPSNRFAKESR